MQTKTRRGLSRRELLTNTVAVGAVAVIGPGFVAAPDAAWAVEARALAPRTLATLILVARDIYPHDRIGDRHYAAAVKPHDEQAATDEGHRALIEDGIADLDALAKAAHGVGYAETGWEADRVALLRQIQNTAFFQSVRGGLVVGLYNQKEVWPVFGYEGESFSQGGYISRGFDDIAWL
ncbi:MAG: Twin-arginine translocation pathway signal [Rubrimonas sp.]